jgi:hypothetical protein
MPFTSEQASQYTHLLARFGETQIRFEIAQGENNKARADLQAFLQNPSTRTPPVGPPPVGPAATVGEVPNE